MFHLNHEFKSANHSFASLLIMTGAFHEMTQLTKVSIFLYLLGSYSLILLPHSFRSHITSFY